MKCYNLDEIKTQLKKEISENKAFAEAWEKVTFPTKKDGKPFAILSKNISGAKVTAEPYAMQSGENELTVYTSCKECGYINDSIKLYELVRYLKGEGMKANTENYMPKQSYLEQVYRFDLEDIKKAVANRAKHYRDRAADLERQNEQAERIFTKFRKAYAEALADLEDSTEQFSHKDLFYAVKDTVLSRFPYC